MKPGLHLIILLTLTTIPALADYGKSYYFKAKITTADTTITGYFLGPYETLSDSVLKRMKSEPRFLQSKILSDKKLSNQHYFEVYSFLYKYRYEKADGEESFVLCKTAEEDRLLIKLEAIKSIKYEDVVIFDSWGNWVTSAINEADLQWIKTRPLKIVKDTSDMCSHEYFIIYENNPEIEKIIKEIMLLAQTNNSLRGEQLRSKLNDFKVLIIKTHQC